MRMTGTLNINDSLNITGSVDVNGNPTSIITWGTLTSGLSVDMIIAVNEDIPSATVPTTTNATASISNVILENATNHGSDDLNGDGDGGCMEFDTGTSGTATLDLTNVIIQNCATTVGDGGGLVTFDFVVRPGTGTVTISNSTIQNNSVSHGTAGAEGGGLTISAGTLATISNSKVLNNNAILVAGGQAGQGGGLALDASGTASGFGSVTINNSTISKNSAAGLGGGIANVGMSLIVGQGTVISGNHSGLGNVVNAQDGGGVYVNTFVSGCPASCPNTVTFQNVTITGNTSTGNGGGISTGNAGAFPAAGPLTITFSRLAGNTATGVGSNLKNGGTTVTATDNWWGTNAAATTINTTGGGTTTFDPFIVLTHNATQAKIKINGTSTLTGDMSKDNHGAAVGLANLDRIIGLPITFDNRGAGHNSRRSRETLNANAQATADFHCRRTLADAAQPMPLWTRYGVGRELKFDRQCHRSGHDRDHYNGRRA